MRPCGSVQISQTIFVAFCLLFFINVECFHDDDHDGFHDMTKDDVDHICEEPPPPLNGNLVCGKHKKKENKYVCKAECDEGYEFPKGKKKVRHICDLKNGKWTPDYDFPDCQAICNPPCGNGGECVEGNHCVCTPDHRGDRCQYALDLCDPNKGLVSADWSCNQTSEQTVCVMNCPQGTRYESPSADLYRCTVDGTWTPSFAPKCIPINVIEPPAAHGMYPVSTGQLVTSSLPNSDVCAVWGASHYRTFDGGIFSFQGPCTYLLSKDCEQNTFAIHIQNAQLCETVSACTTTLAIYIGSEQYILANGQDGGAIVQNAGKIHVIPAAVNGLLFQILSDYVTVSSSIGFRLKWNRKNTVLLKATSQLHNRTCGLCGKFDGSVLNDFETSDGSLTDSVEGFVNSWIMEDLGEKCENKAVVKDPCSQNKDIALESEKLCRVIFDDRFSTCHKLVDPKVYFEVCKMDHCSCPSGSCRCGTLSEYFRECTRLGGKIDGGWRSDELCPLSCPEGMVYKDCGTSCPKTCKKTVYDCEDSHCVDGCHCPDGMVLHNERCVEKMSCPCMHNGKEYQTGERMLVDCNACECNAGKWQCTKQKCEARCTSAGDPHYTTFDGLNYEFLGSCPYYLVFNDNFTVVQESGPCLATSGSEPATEGMFCTNSITINYLGDTLQLQPGIKVTFNEKGASLPISGKGISASMATDLFLKVNMENDVSILWDGQNRIYIDAPTTLFGQTMGLCGTFNKNQNDDFLTPNGDIEVNVDAFASRWKASDSCHKRQRRRSSHNPCEAQPQKLKDAELLCSSLKHEVFEACHGELDPASYYKSCVSDLCICNRDLKDCLCPILADYSLACTKKNVIVNWIDEITPCKLECSGGQVYQECGNPCTSTCAAISSSNFCTMQCVQGCTCADGMTLNNEGFCIAIDQCPCVYEEKEYPPASVTVQGSNVCTCQGAEWQCRLGTLSELVSLNSNLMIDDDPSQKCLSQNNEEFTQCREECPKTCQNLHLPQNCKTEECRPGCRCKEGFVFDAERNKCVEEKECGCVHGRRRYREGEEIKQSCNLCTCREGTWQCTEKICPGMCSVWGESHFKTFDGKIFDFHGECEYILSKGKMKGASYTLSVQNVPCGTSGVTCSKSFTLEIGPLKTSRGDISEITAEAEKLTLSRDDPLPKTTYSSRFVVIEVGLFVMVYTDIGVSLQWDKGTRIYVTAEPKWRERVKGLCGNFNDDQADDFLTPSGGIPEARSSIFAESWKIHEFCPAPLTVEDACEIHPQRKSWAQQKCGILKSEDFSTCHSEVAMEPFYERCVFDSCACDMGGDCECLCTAIAAYAQECSLHGISIKWRSQELCPIQCEECATYDSCIPSCPKKTCENELVYGKIEQACSVDFCVEGCNPKPCPDGQIYNNAKEYKCIPQVECVVPCMELNGMLYNEGDRVTDVQVVDACQSCHCLRGTISCDGPPCADIEPAKACIETGWTPWLNTPSLIGGDFEVLTDPRLKATLENYCGITNMTDIECRVAKTKQPYKEVGQRVSCRLPQGLSCKDEEQGDSVCEDYEIRVYCDCGPIPTTEVITIAVTTPSMLAPVCEETGWSAWMSGHWPDEEGESETLDRLRVNHYFCADKQIENIECRSTITWKYANGEDENVVCNKNLGLVCKGSKCEDYEVRVYCKCGIETTVLPVPTCVTGWSEYFNTDHPDSSDTGDDESLDRIRERHDFCVGGTIEDIECKAKIGDSLIDYTERDTFGLKCSKTIGFQCNKYVRSTQCEDFVVRFYCQCEAKEVTVPVTTVVTTTTTTIIPQTPVPVECGWTPWLNIDDPVTGEGDIEDLLKIQSLYKTCAGKDLIDIECRMSRTHHQYSDSLQKNLVCDKEHGFQCLNEDQIGPCYDYEVRLLCMYQWCFPPTTTPVPTTPTTRNPCPDGQTYDICAYHCDQLCTSFSVLLVEKCTTSLDGCIADCRPDSGCKPPNKWRDRHTCVSKQECPCTISDENGEVVNLAPGEVIVKECEKCQCLETVMCHRIPGCGMMEEPSKPRIYIQEDCWTKWVNTHNPDTGGGDFEVPNVLRRSFEYCDNPVKAECRTVSSKQKPFDVGQSVTCSANEGLICWNKENEPKGCYDYEIRFFCPCPTQATTTTTPIPTLAPGVCEYGWTDWFNNHIPDQSGDFETVQSSRIYNIFCSSDMISAMECREVGKTVGQLQHGVICDLDIGLKCNAEFLDGEERCGDYEVRFFCDCPTMIPITQKYLREPTTTPAPPIHLACAYWSDWINENHPGSGAGGTKKGGVKGGGGHVTGDHEEMKLLKLQREYKFCTEGYISDIECREANTELDYTETGDNKLICNDVKGFMCKGKDQPNKICKDYKIRYFCSCREISTTPVTIKPTTPEIFVKPCSNYYHLVDGPNPLPDTQLKASTSKDSSSGPQSARLSSTHNQKSAGAWIAGELNEFQFIEIDLGRIQPVYGVVTKGRNAHKEWVKSYKVLYSRDGRAYSYVRDPESQNGEKIFTGNYDSDSEVEHVFFNPIEARYVRIQPISFYREIAMRVDVLGCSGGMDNITITTTIAPPCIDEMGLYNGIINDYQIKTTSDRNPNSDARYIRLNTAQTEEHTGGWVAGHLDDEQFVQIDLLDHRNLTGVKLQGRDMVPQWVTAFTVSYSSDGEIWNAISEARSIKVFPGSHDSSTVTIVYFPQPIRARFIRIHPVDWEGWIAMRLEILGCFEPYPEILTEEITTPKLVFIPEHCVEPMGFESHQLPDAQISVSSSQGPNSDASRIRLETHREGKKTGGWIAATYDYMPVVFIDFEGARNFTGIVTQGLEEDDMWVLAYKIRYSLDNKTWEFAYDVETNGKVFEGNVDSNSRVLRYFSTMIEARFLEIIIINYHTFAALRMEMLGCFIPYTPPCIDQMGLYNGFIKNYQINTTSDQNPNSDARYIRLNTPETEEHSGGWVAGHLDDEQFVQIDLLDHRNLTGVKLQGRDMVPQWVTAFTVSYSNDGELWDTISEPTGIKVFPGSHDSSTVTIVYFPQPINARFIRIHPVDWENRIAMRLEILGCFETDEEVKPSIGTTREPIYVPEHCVDHMGFENHQLPDTQISVSSSQGPNSDASRIRLDTHREGEKTGGWIAATYDHAPVVFIDFDEPRNLTGILTQGLEDDDLWVVSYKIRYSLDNKTWEFTSDIETGNDVFNGNFDRNSHVLRIFSTMIEARFLEIIIIDYHTFAALRMEMLGCFIPYPVYTAPPPELPTTEFCVQNGPWISLADPASSGFGDEEPIDKIISSSGVCSNPYDIECRTLVTQKDYRLTGQILTCDLEHGLLCKNRKQSSYQCYNYEVRLKCWTCGEETVTTPLPLMLCPEVPDIFKNNCPLSCAQGYACDGTHCVPSPDCPCFKDGKRFEPSNIVITPDCRRCECILGGFSTCEPVKCPDCLPGQKSEMDSSCHCQCVGCQEGTRLCPTSGECIDEERWCDGIMDCPDDETGCPTTTTLTPTTTTVETTTLPAICSTDYLPDTDSCEMVSNMFETFDGLTYQYDICDHVLMKEASSELYSVTVHKTCASEIRSSCDRYLVIEVDEVTIKLGPGIEDVTVQDTRVPVATLWLVSKRFQDFELKKRGNTIVFSSKKYNFDVTWDMLQDTKITVSKCLVHKIVGLCGLYNHKIYDDITMPDGRSAGGNEEFGNSWSIGSLERCKPPECPQDFMKVAIDVCKELGEEPFNSSCSEYLKIESRVEACVVYMCECMERQPLDARMLPSKDVLYDFFSSGSCKCDAYESFVEACENAKQTPVHEWRIQHDCTPECPIGMEWQDCGPGCELTCDNYQQREEICIETCVPGCYCPSGLVRHHNRCVKPKMCQDCVCRGHGDPNYITFDGRYYAFQGNCTYILAQHQASYDEVMNFQVLANNVECPEEPHTSCTQGLTILWNGHIIEKFKNKPVYLDQVALNPEDSPVFQDGISITFIPNKSTLVHIKEINLAVRYFDQMYGFNIELPAFFYFNKTEGLCGVCNFIQSDDLYHRDGYVTEDIEDFAYSWLEEHETRKNCILPREEVIEPPPGICNFTVSPCEIFLDPTLYSQSCQNDVSYSRKPEASVCRSKFQYAQQCCERGVTLVEWLKLSGCETSCPEGMLHECTSACQKTCDNYKTYDADDCDMMPLYTCVCPEGEVLKLGKCVKTTQCEVCDIEGHIVGEVWQVGPCKICECMPDLSTSCTVTECPEPPLCNARETLQKLSRSANACCDAYHCMPFEKTTCPETPLEECPPGQAYVKDYVDGCPIFQCQCIPDMCPPPIMPLLDDGENYTLSTVDCCTEYIVFCDIQSCDPAPSCGPGFKLSTYQSKCCEKYKCIPRKDVCVYQHKFDVVDGKQVDLPFEEHYDQEYERDSSWQDGLCRKCSCVDLDGQFAYNCREEICPDPNEFPDAEKYVREEIHAPGACCPKYHRVACKVDDVIYRINVDWPSPEGDPCKSYRCVTDPKGEAVRLEKTTICDRTCPEHAVYIEPAPGSGKCCGACKAVACEEDGKIYKDGEEWVSATKPCFTAECAVNENGTRITYRSESCPYMPDNCAPEDVRTDPKGCCTYCKIPTETCSAVEVPSYETVGFFGYVDENRGYCYNEQVLKGLTKCGGQCTSNSLYSDLVGDFQSVCNCCLPKESQNRTIPLECEDGSTVKKVYMQPISCQCLSCSGSSRSLEALNQVQPYKK